EHVLVRWHKDGDGLGLPGGLGAAVRAPGAEPDCRLDRRLVEIPPADARTGGEEVAHHRHAHGPGPYHRHPALHRTPPSSRSAAGAGSRRLAMHAAAPVDLPAVKQM